jgi:hypothetical protein
MNDNLRMIVYIVRHDPAVIAGFALVAISSTLLFHVQLKISRVGRPYMLFRGFDALVECFKMRKQYRWPAWPAYCFCVCFPLGIASLVFGLFRL